MERMALKKFTASAGGGTITTSGSFNLEKEAPEAILSLTGKGLDVASLTAGFLKRLNLSHRELLMLTSMELSQDQLVREGRRNSFISFYRWS